MLTGRQPSAKLSRPCSTIFASTQPTRLANVTEAAGFLQVILEGEGLAVTRDEAAPGKVNLATRLKGSGEARPILLLHHMDVVPADASRQGQVVMPVDHRATPEWDPAPSRTKARF